jgi:hypothetical protein
MHPQTTRPAMHVSFDIDDTLVCGPEVPTEQFVPFWYRRRYAEQVRRGCRELMQALAARGCPIWLYTSSRRPPRYLRGWFLCMGIRLEGIVNLCRHEEVVGYRGPSKYPPAFGIGLHVDDSAGVAMEGQSHGFRVVLVSPQDERWTERVLEAVDAIIGPHRAPMRVRPPAYRLADARAVV